MERVRGIEPPYSAWEADVLPLNYTRGWQIVTILLVDIEADRDTNIKPEGLWLLSTNQWGLDDKWEDDLLPVEWRGLATRRRRSPIGW